MKNKSFHRVVAASLTFASLLAIFLQQPASAKEADEGRNHSGTSSPGNTLKEGLRSEAQTERNRGNDATANRLDNMADRLNTGNISDAEASDISRAVAKGELDTADSLVNRGSRE